MKKKMIITSRQINIVLICLLSALVIFTPFYPYKKMISLTTVFFLWFLTTLRQPKWLSKTIPFVFFFLLAFLLDLISSIANNDSDILKDFFTQKLFVYIWAFIFCYYIDKPDLIRKFISPTLIMILISCCFTIKGNIVFPGASRMLASDNQINALYHSMNIGGYDFVNGIVFLILPLAVYIKRLEKYKSFFILCLFVLLITIATGSYTIGLLLSVAMLVVSITNPKKKMRFVILFFLILGVAVFSHFLLDLIGSIGKWIGSDILVQRAEMIKYRDFVESSGENRFVLYQNGLINFTHNPFFGKMLGNYGPQLYSKHSAMINYFESYGLFAVVYLSYWRNVIKSNTKCYISRETKYYYYMYMMVFLLFVIMNTIDSANGIGYFAGFLGPSMLLCSEKPQIDKEDTYKCLIK